MTSAKIVHQSSWADIVKGKTLSAFPAAQEFKFNTEAPEFAINELKMNALAQEFVPPPTESLEPSAKTVIPSEHKLLHKASEMQRLLLECYTDDDESSDDEVQCQPSAAVLQKGNKVRKSVTPVIAPFRPPPGLSPPEVASLNPFADVFDPSGDFPGGKLTDSPPVVAFAALAHAALNPSAKEFAPAAVQKRKWGDVEFKYGSAINFEGFSSDSSDDESIACTPRKSCAKQFAPEVVHMYQWRDVACKLSAINFVGLSSDSEDDESPVSTPRNSKADLLQDSTSAGESSDSEAESWSGLHSA